jgi:hypothetical protein
MSKLTFGTEPSNDVGRGERGELAQRRQAQPAEHVGQLGTFEHTDR